MKKNIRQLLVIGPSGVGKSTCVKKIMSHGFSKALDMDKIINTNKIHDKERLVELIVESEAQVVAVSVITELLEYFCELKSKGVQKSKGWYFVYLRLCSESDHKERLLLPNADGNLRSEKQVSVQLGSINKLDPICLDVADIVVNVSQNDADDVYQIVNFLCMNNVGVKLNLLTKEKYMSVANKVGGVHWASPGSRWCYHEVAVEWIKELGIKSGEQVLEAGSMGVTLVEGSDTVDYVASDNNSDWDWNPGGVNSSIVHDLRKVPWPFKDKQYSLFVALRVFHHLKPVQRECFLEAKRISSWFIVVVPNKEVHPRGIDLDEMIEWNGGVAPEKYHHFPRQAGSCYLWRS